MTTPSKMGRTILAAPIWRDATSRCAMIVFGAALAGCGGGADSGGTTGPQTPAVVASVSVTPSAPALLVGGTVDLAGTPLDSHGATLSGRTVAWSSSNSAVASVSTTGTVTGIAPGSATVSATVGSVRGDASVTVALPAGKAITVAVATTALFTADTMTVVATVRDAAGAIIVGKQVQWTSSASAIATVSANGKVTALSVGVTDVSAQVDGVSTSVHLDVQPHVVTDVAHATSKMFDKTGGTVSTTTAAGATITLSVPAGAIGATPLRITVTPLTALKGLPRDAQMISAVKLEPSGTKFQKPITLSIQGAGVVQNGKVLVGFIASDTAGDVSLLPAHVVGNAIQILVPHFSIIGSGAVFPPELADLEHPVPTDAAGSSPALLQDVLAHPALTSVEQQDLIILELQKWGNRITKLAKDALDSDALLVDVIPQYNYWRSMVLYMEQALEIPAGSLYKFERISSTDSDMQYNLELALENAIGRANGACLLLHDIHQIRAVMFWQGQAQDLGIATDTFGSALKRPAVIAGLCARVVLTDTQFGVDLQAGEGSLVRLRWGVRFSNSPAVVNMELPFDALITGSETVQTPRGKTDTDGFADFLVLPKGGVDLSISGTTCLPPGDVDATDICTPFSVQQSVPVALTFGGTLGSGTVGIAYTGTLQATGGSGIYQFSLKAGTLPAGLQLVANGASLTVRGTPTAGGTFAFTVRLTAGTHTVDRAFAIAITGVLPVAGWQDDGFVWHFHCPQAGCTQPRGLRFEIYRANDGTTRARAFQPVLGFPTAFLLFDIAISTNNGVDFSGSEAIPSSLGNQFFFAGWITTVSGTIQSDGSLSLSWREDSNDGSGAASMTGDGVLSKR
ncbi:MAG: Ig-like domain-containing protein [Gemmatimonadaceae bacterium]